MFHQASPTTTLLQIMENIQARQVITPQQESEIKLLLAKGADPTIGTSSTSNTVLLLSILYGNESYVMEIINLIKNQAALNQPDKFSFALNSPLLIAIKRGMYDAAILLVERGVELDYVSHDGFTALHFACGLVGIENEESKDTRLIALIHKMLDHGADPRMLNCFNSTSLDLLKFNPAPLDFMLVQETKPYRIARVLNISPELAKSWCQFETNGEWKKMKSPEFKKINDLYASYKNFDNEMAARKSDDEINKMHATYQRELDVFHDTFNKKLYTVGMIVRHHMYGARKSSDIYQLLDQKIFEHPHRFKRTGNRSDIDDFMTILDDTHWHRFDGTIDYLKSRLIGTRRHFYKNHENDIKKLEEHMLKKIEELNVSAPSHSVKQFP